MAEGQGPDDSCRARMGPSNKFNPRLHHSDQRPADTAIINPDQRETHTHTHTHPGHINNQHHRAKGCKHTHTQTIGHTAARPASTGWDFVNLRYRSESQNQITSLSK